MSLFLVRLVSNRLSARQSRERKRNYIADLEAYVEFLEAARVRSDEMYRQLMNENQLLKQSNVQLALRLSELGGVAPPPHNT